MKNQFAYTIKHNIGTTEAPEFKESKASFNIDMVIRSLELPDGKLIIILDDFHEEMVKQPDQVNTKTNRIIHGKKEMAVVQSEITLEVEDKERFFNLLSI